MTELAPPVKSVCDGVGAILGAADPGDSQNRMRPLRVAPDRVAATERSTCPAASARSGDGSISHSVTPTPTPTTAAPVRIVLVRARALPEDTSSSEHVGLHD